MEHPPAVALDLTPHPSWRRCGQGKAPPSRRVWT